MIKFEDVIQFPLKQVSLGCLLFDSHLTTHQSNIGVHLRKVANYHPHTLMCKASMSEGA
jgi:hypothetical protein